MTSDAKIGLLLGLVFIFIIAFIINGVPSFSKDDNNNELTTNIVSSQNKPPGIATKERKVNRQLIGPVRPTFKQSLTTAPPARNNLDTRFEMPLPINLPVAKQTSQGIGIKRTTAPMPPVPPIAQKNDAKKARPPRARSPRVYVVREGDSLADIAVKHYGSQEGNRHVNVSRIFHANRKLLKSPDEVYPGQRLAIPPLSASQPEQSGIENVFTTTLFEKVKSIGQKRPASGGRKAGQSRAYVVREGDSLWEIAADKLGDGNRYNEIAKLNAHVIDDEDTLTVGMRLKLPAR
jgi:nucleoid-associated protein YgaU